MSMKTVISEFVSALPNKDVDYFITKYIFEDEIIEKRDIHGVKSYFICGSAKSLNQTNSTKKNDLSPIVRWTNDGRRTGYLLTEMNSRVTIVPYEGKLIVSTDNFSFYDTLTPAIAKLYLCEFLLRKDFIPNI